MFLHSGIKEKFAFCPNNAHVCKFCENDWKFIEYVVWFFLLCEQKQTVLRSVYRIMWCFDP